MIILNNYDMIYHIGSICSLEVSTYRMLLFMLLPLSVECRSFALSNLPSDLSIPQMSNAYLHWSHWEIWNGNSIGALFIWNAQVFEAHIQHIQLPSFPLRYKLLWRQAGVLIGLKKNHMTSEGFWDWAKVLSVRRHGEHSFLHKLLNC